MAMESKPTRSLECSVCLEEFKDPRILPCYHTFCRQCLQWQIDSSINVGEYSCPVCRAHHKVPAQGIAGIQKNFYVTEMLEMKSGSKSKHPFCKDHPTEDMRFYCVTCKKPICRDCKVVSHEGHKIDMITKIYEEKKAFVQRLLKSVESGKADLDKQHALYRATFERKTKQTKSFVAIVEQKMRNMQEKLQSLTDDIKRETENWIAEIKENDKCHKCKHEDAQTKLQKDIQLLSSAVKEIDDGKAINKFNILLGQEEVVVRHLVPSQAPPINTVSATFVARFCKFNRIIKTEIEAFEKEYYGEDGRLFPLPGKRKESEEPKPGTSTGEQAQKKARVEKCSSDETSESSSDSSSESDSN